MKLKLKAGKEVIKVTGNHPALADTPLKGTDVEFLIEPVTYSERNEQSKKARIQDSEGFDIDTPKFVIGTLHKALIGWNLEDEDGEPIPCTSGNKELLFEKYPKITDALFSVASSGGPITTLTKDQASQLKN